MLIFHFHFLVSEILIELSILDKEDDVSFKSTVCFHSTSSSFISKDQGKVDSSRHDPSKIITIMIMNCVLFFLLWFSLIYSTHLCNLTICFSFTSPLVTLLLSQSLRELRDG